jgi:hypothetical protein
MGRSSIPCRVKKFHFSMSSYRLWGSPNLVPSGYRVLFPRGKEAGAWSWPLTSNWCWRQENVDLYIRSPIRTYPALRVRGVSNETVRCKGLGPEESQRIVRVWVNYRPVLTSERAPNNMKTVRPETCNNINLHLQHRQHQPKWRDKNNNRRKKKPPLSTARSTSRPQKIGGPPRPS